MVACALLAYLCGSIPFGLILTKIAGHGDIRDIGSGNIGATNVLRTGSRMLALGTLFCDAAKGFLPVLIAQFFGSGFAAVALVFALLGHIFPVWLGFRGGKGVATGFGGLLAYAWPVAIAVIGVWIVFAVAFRYSSLAAIAAAAATPFLAWPYFANGAPWTLFLVAALVIWRHSENIARLLRGEESKIALKT